jgi:hypothetical protein
MSDIELEVGDNNAEIEQSNENELNLDFDQSVETESEEHDEESGEIESGERGAHRIAQLRKAERNLRTQNADLKAQFQHSQAQIQQLQSQVSQYAELFQATHANSVPNSSTKQNEGELSPDLSIEERVNKIIEQREQEKNKKSVAMRNAQEINNLNNELAQSVENAKQKYPDYEDVVFRDDLPFTKSIVDTIRFLPNQGEIFYALAKNPKELARINSLSTAQQIKTIANHSVKIASRLNSSSSNSPAPIASKLPSKSGSQIDYSSMSVSEIRQYKQSLRRS